MYMYRRCYVCIFDSVWYNGNQCTLSSATVIGEVCFIINLHVLPNVRRIK